MTNKYDLDNNYLFALYILNNDEKMTFDAIVFIPSDESFTEREKQMVQRTVGHNPLFIVMDSESKARSLRDYVESLDANDITIISMHNPDSRYLLPYLAGVVSGGVTIDITFASAYYASSVTLLSKSKGAKIIYTQWDGSVSVIYQPIPSMTEMDDQSKRIMNSLIAGPKALSELETELDMNYKTLARRASYLLKGGYISKTDDYPLRYYLTEEQETEHNLSCRPEVKRMMEGQVFRSAMQALLSENNIIMGTVRIE